MKIGNKLREYRYKGNYSQQEIAEFLDVSQSTYCNWESDTIFPKAENLIKIAKFYNIDINELLFSEIPISIVNSPNTINNSPNSKVETSEALIKISEGLEKLILVFEKLIDNKKL